MKIKIIKYKLGVWEIRKGGMLLKKIVIGLSALILLSGMMPDIGVQHELYAEETTSVQETVLSSKAKNGKTYVTGGKTGNELVVPSKLNGKTIEGVGDSAFLNSNAVQKLSFESGVKTIGSYAFENCRNLKTVTFSDSISKIGEGAFSWCRSLKTVKLPEGLTVISRKTFYRCSGLESVVIPSSVTTIQSEAFKNCSSLKEIEFENGSKISSIAKDAFDDCGVDCIISCSESDMENESIKALEKIIDEGSKAGSDGKSRTKINNSQKVDYSYDKLKRLTKAAYQNSGELDYTYDNNGNITKIVTTDSKSVFTGFSMILGSNIGINVFADLKSDLTNDKDAFIRFIMSDNSAIEQKISDPAGVNGSEYSYQCNVSAKQMNEPIIIQIISGNGAVVDSVKYKASDYLNQLSKTDSKYSGLCESLIEYSTSAAYYFGNKNVKAKSYSESDYKEIADKITLSSGIKDDDYIGTSLLLKNKTVLRHYFSKNAEGRKAKYDDSGKVSMYYIEQEFAPGNYNMKISGYDFSIYDYIGIVLKRDDIDSDLKNLCVSLYNYSQECIKLL